MRLTQEQQRIITGTLKQHFGAASQIWLFGSRVNDDVRGGDIDLYIEPEIQAPDAVVQARLDALIELKQRLGEQKIDLVIHRRQAPVLPIHRIAKDTGLPL